MDTYQFVEAVHYFIKNISKIVDVFWEYKFG